MRIGKSTGARLRAGRALTDFLLLFAMVGVTLQIFPSQAIEPSREKSTVFDWRENTQNGHWYRLTEPDLSWLEAESQAQSKGGHLVTINDATEQEWIYNHFADSKRIWIGFTDMGQEGHWTWLTNDGGIWDATAMSGTSYTNWGVGEPNNNADEDYALMVWPDWNGVIGGWTDGKDSVGNRSYGLIEATQPTPWYNEYDFASKGVVAYWPLDGTAEDVTGNGNDGIVVGATPTNGMFGGSYHFDGTSYIDLNENYSGLNEITYSLWFKAEVLAAHPEPVGHHGRVPFRHRGNFADHNPSVWSNRMSVSIHDLDGNPYADTTLPISTQAWHHLAYGYGDGILFAYLDGEKVIDEPRTGSIDWSNYMWTRIGYHSSNYEFLNWIGEVDEVVVFNRVISPYEARLLASDANDNDIADFWEDPAGSGWIENPTTNHYYRLTTPMNWLQAKETAENWGGYLVTINDAEEETWLDATFNYAEARRAADMWIGFNDIQVEGEWEWLNGESALYTNWYSGEPNDGGDPESSEDAAVMNYFR
ncbi:MAG: hypothetical protein KC931_08920, partial [Candidatus Omnitrophica bacterium]|nr:hypothetical protein [Candidatus Omnitrophota bacterium]